MDAVPSPQSARASKNRTNTSFDNAAPVHNQVGAQDVRGSIYNNYGPVHYHPTRTAHAFSRSEPEAADFSYNTRSNFADTDTKEERIEKERQRRFKDLHFEQLETRHATIEKAYAQTCQWILHQPEYLEWKNGYNIAHHHNFLWIKGKPGSGKSTLMKFLFNYTSPVAQNELERNGDLQTVVVAFFFNARGSSLETSPIGTYRSLLFQILDMLPDLRTTLDRLPVMTIASLQTVLEEVVRKLGRRTLTLFIDALDECYEEDIQEMIYFFGDLATIAFKSNVSLHICLSSRHYPFIQMKHGLSLILENQQQHTDDMREYVQSQLDIGQSESAQSIRNKILHKASGVFLWVKLVVKILNGRYRRGRLFDLEQHLNSLPSALEDLFSDILTREGTDDPRAQKELALCLQWVLFAYRPLTPTELYFGILIGTSSTCSPWWISGDPTEDDMHRFILSCSKGLLEQTRSKPATIQFIHESVRNFFLSGTSLVELGSVEDVAGFADARLAECCLAYINSIRLSDIMNVDFDNLPDTQSVQANYLRDLLSQSLPLFFYTIRYLLRHSDSALVLGIPQDDILARLDLGKILRLHNLLVLYPSERHNARQTHLTYFLAASDLPNLLSKCLTSVPKSEFDYGLHDSLLHGTHSARGWTALRVLLTPLPHDVPLPMLNQSLSQQAREDIDGTLYRFQHTETIPRNKTILCWAIDNRQLPVVRCLLRTGRINPNLPSSDGSTPLALAALNGNAQMLATLLCSGAKAVTNSVSNQTSNLLNADMKANKTTDTSPVNAQLPKTLPTHRAESSFSVHHKPSQAPHDSIWTDVDSDSTAGKASVALHAAARGGHDSIVRSLLTAGADVNQFATGGETALHLAAKNGHDETVRILLVSGAEVNAMSEQWGTALHVASKNHNDLVINALIDGGADVNTLSDVFGTALHVAARYDYSEISQILIHAGIDMNLQYGINKMTALHEAVAKGHIVTTSVLLGAGADPRVTNGTKFNALMIAITVGQYQLLKMMLQIYVDEPDSNAKLSLAQKLTSLSDNSEAEQMLRKLISFTVASNNFAVLRLLFRKSEIKQFVNESLHFSDELLMLAVRRHSIKSFQAMIGAGLVFTSLTTSTCETIASAADGDRELLKKLLGAVTDEQDHLYKLITWDYFIRAHGDVGPGA